LPAKPTPATVAQRHPTLIELEDLWVMVDQAGKPGPVLTFNEMNAAKARNAERRTPQLQPVTRPL
jgi:hypothetical protein